MSVNDANAEDVSLRYWKAVISTLPTEKRDAAWEFYLNRFSNDRAGDTLSGLILLLEANGIFMQTLPQEFKSELIQPMRQATSSLRDEVILRAKLVSSILESNQQTLKQVGESTEAIHKAADNVAGKIEAAVQHISTERLAERICHSLTASTLNRLWDAVERLNCTSIKMDEASTNARRSIELWRKVHIGKMFTWAIATAFISSVVLCWFAHGKIRAHYEKQYQQKVALLLKERP